MKKALYLAAVALCCSAIAAAPATAAPLTGTYTTGGATTGTGPWTLTSTDSTYSVLRFVLDSAIDFGDLSSVIVDYTANAGFSGIGQGTPRLAIVTDANHDNTADGQIIVHFGPAGSFVDGSVGAASTGNLLTLSDLGRYDLSGIGGSAYTDRDAALAAASGLGVLRLSLIVDSFGGLDRSFTINGISAAGVGNVGGAVPEPATWAMMIGGFALAGAAIRRRKATVSFA